MKNLIVLSSLAALAAFLLLSVGFMAATSLVFAAGFSAIVAVDYARQPRPLRVRSVHALASARQERFGLAA